MSTSVWMKRSSWRRNTDLKTTWLKLHCQWRANQFMKKLKHWKLHRYNKKLSWGTGDHEKICLKKAENLFKKSNRYLSYSLCILHRDALTPPPSQRRRDLREPDSRDSGTAKSREPNCKHKDSQKSESTGFFSEAVWFASWIGRPWPLTHQALNKTPLTPYLPSSEIISSLHTSHWQVI